MIGIDAVAKIIHWSYETPELFEIDGKSEVENFCYCSVTHGSTMLVNNSADASYICHAELILFRFEYYSIFLETFKDGFYVLKEFLFIFSEHDAIIKLNFVDKI